MSKLKCPKCGSRNVDLGKALIVNVHGEIEGYDYQPTCLDCGYVFGDEVNEQRNSDIESE